MSGWVGDHGGCDVLSVLLKLFFDVIDVDFTLLITYERDDFHTAHDSCGGVGAVGGCGDKADVSVSLAS